MRSDVRGPQFVFRIAKNKNLMTAMQTALIFAVYMIISVGAMRALEPTWTNIDGAYFAIATVTTVGYGDIAPTSDGSRWIAIFMIVFGITTVFSAVAGVIAHGLAPITKYGRELMETAVSTSTSWGLLRFTTRRISFHLLYFFLRSRWPLRASLSQLILRTHLASGCTTALSRRRLSDTETP